MMPKVLIVNVTANQGSTGRIAEMIGVQAQSNGWKVYMASGRGGNSSQLELVNFSSKWSVRLHGIISMLFDRHGFASRRATQKLIDSIEEINPDLIHLHNVHGYYLHIGLLFDYLRKRQKPIMMTLHDCWMMTGHCAHFERIGCKKWINGCYSCPLKGRYPRSILFDQSKRNYKEKKNLLSSLEHVHIVVPSLWLANIVKQSYLSKFSVQVIYNGVDSEVFIPKSISNKDNDKFMILGVANVWNKAKGLSDFIELNAYYAQQNIFDKQIVLIGLTKEQIRNLPDGIIGIERTDSVAQLADYYRSADVFLNPTYSDNFPTTNIEALACGTPVITYDTGGSPEAIDEDTGIVVNKDSDYQTNTNCGVQGLIHAIDTIQQRGKLAYSEKCRARFELLFSAPDRYKDYFELYQKIVKS